LQKGVKVLGKCLNAICKFAEVIAAVLLAIMCTLVFANVLTRYVFHYAIPWSEEMARFLEIWVCFLGAALLYKEDGHMGLDILVKVLPKQVARICQVVVDCLVLYIAWLIGFGGYQLTASNMAWKAPATGLSYAWKFGITVAAAALIMIFAVTKLYWHILSIIKNKDLIETKKTGGGDL